MLTPSYVSPTCLVQSKLTQGKKIGEELPQLKPKAVMR